MGTFIAHKNYIKMEDIADKAPGYLLVLGGFVGFLSGTNISIIAIGLGMLIGYISGIFICRQIYLKVRKNERRIKSDKNDIDDLVRKHLKK